MTVKELIEALSELEPDLPVFIEVGIYKTARSRRPTVIRINAVEVSQNVTVPDYDGQAVDPDYVAIEGYQER